VLKKMLKVTHLKIYESPQQLLSEELQLTLKLRLKRAHIRIDTHHRLTNLLFFDLITDLHLLLLVTHSPFLTGLLLLLLPVTLSPFLMGLLMVLFLLMVHTIVITTLILLQVRMPHGVDIVSIRMRFLVQIPHLICTGKGHRHLIRIRTILYIMNPTTIIPPIDQYTVLPHQLLQEIAHQDQPHHHLVDKMRLKLRVKRPGNEDIVLKGILLYILHLVW
jgi:hypothetical protein